MFPDYRSFMSTGVLMQVNLENALEELGVSEEDYREFLGDLLVYANELVPQLEAIIKGEMPRKEMHQLAHSLKGACRNMRFVAAGDLANQLEKWGAKDAELDPAPVYTELRKTLVESFAQFGMKTSF